MSEFKFACPVCGQHITANSSASGTQLDCPTCFQRMVVPQAPVYGDSKLILSAAKVSGPKTALSAETTAPENESRSRSWKRSLVPLLLLVVTGGAAFLLWRSQLTGLANRLAERTAGSPAAAGSPTTFQSPNPIPKNISWTLNLSNAVIPDSAVAGSIHGNGFLCERAVLKGNRLFLRQGAPGHTDLGLSVSLGGRTLRELAGKAIVVTPNTPMPASQVVLRWRDEQQMPTSEHIRSGYAMKLYIGPVAEERMEGRIYIALPDREKSFAAGKFEAEIIPSNQPLAGK